MAYFSAMGGSGAGGGATITVSYDSSFYNKTITCSDGTTTYTKTTTSSGSTEFKVKDEGTWTVTCNGASKQVQVTLNYSTQMAITRTITVYGAASDTISFTDMTGAKTVTTNTSGQGSVSITFIPNSTITFTSSVAKSPSNLSQSYSRTVTVDSNTSEVKVMPDNALYWYGYKDANCESISPENGWSKSGGWAFYAFVNPTYNTIDVTLAGSSNQLCGIGANTTTSSISKVHAITQGITITNNSGGVMGCTTTKTFPLGANIDNAATDTTVKHVTYTPQSPLSNSRAVAYLNDTRSYKLYGLWYE